MMAGIAPQGRTSFKGAVKFPPDCRGLEQFRKSYENKAQRVLSDATGTSFQFRSHKKQRAFVEQAKIWLLAFAENTKLGMKKQEFQDFHNFTRVSGK